MAEIVEKLKETYKEKVMPLEGAKREDAIYKFYTRYAPEIAAEIFRVDEKGLDNPLNQNLREKLGLAHFENIFTLKPYRIEIKEGEALFEKLVKYWKEAGSKNPEVDTVLSLKYLTEQGFPVDNMPPNAVLEIRDGRIRCDFMDYDVSKLVTIELDTKEKLEEIEKHGRPYEQQPKEKKEKTVFSKTSAESTGLEE